MTTTREKTPLPLLLDTVAVARLEVPTSRPMRSSDAFESPTKIEMSERDRARSSGSDEKRTRRRRGKMRKIGKILLRLPRGPLWPRPVGRRERATREPWRSLTRRRERQQEKERGTERSTATGNSRGKSRAPSSLLNSTSSLARSLSLLSGAGSSLALSPPPALVSSPAAALLSPSRRTHSRTLTHSLAHPRRSTPSPGPHSYPLACSAPPCVLRVCTLGLASSSYSFDRGGPRRRRRRPRTRRVVARVRASACVASRSRCTSLRVPTRVLFLLTSVRLVFVRSVPRVYCARGRT